MKLLEIKELENSIGDKKILKGLNLEIGEGEIHVIMGPNGAGKSTLAGAIIGNPKFKTDKGVISFEGSDITASPVHERAKHGIFVAFQSPEEIDGITLKNFLKTAKKSIENRPIKVLEFSKDLDKSLKDLSMDKEYADRYLNLGFSGGEKKKSEILQMLVLKPKLAILDEIDSGLDIDAIKVVADGINKYHDKNNSLLIITHNIKLLEYIKPDFVHILANGKLVKTGDAALIKEIEKTGFKEVAGV